MTHLPSARAIAPLIAAGVVLAACPDSPGPADGTSTTSTTGTSSGGIGDTTASPDESTGSTTASPGTGADGESSTTGSDIDDPGCPACTVLAVGLENGRGIAVDLDFVYFTDQARGTVERVPKGGGEVSVLVADQDQPYGVAVSSEHVYWSNFVSDGAVLRAPLTGGATTLVGNVAFPRTVAVVGDHVYWGTFEPATGIVARVPTTLAEAPATITSVSAGVADLVVGGDRVFFTAHTTSDGVGFDPQPDEPPFGSVFATPPGAGPFEHAELEQLTTDEAEPWGIALQDTTLVWINGTGDPPWNPYSVFSMSTAGTIRRTLASGQTSPWDVAVDDEYVYWTDFTEVKAAPLGVGAEIVLAEQQNTARSIVVDDQSVYWVTSDRVLQRPKP